MIKKDKALRDHLKEVRSAIGKARRSQVERVLMGSLYEVLSPYKKILSYAAKGSEVDLELINQKLCAEREANATQSRRGIAKGLYYD